jgi:hypothetical protein
MTPEHKHIAGLRMALDRWNDGGPGAQYAALLLDLIAQAQTAPEPEPVQGEAQVMARVHHNDDHPEPVRACLNSIGRMLPDGAPLYAALPPPDAELVELLMVARSELSLVSRGQHSAMEAGHVVERLDAKLAELRKGEA